MSNSDFHKFNALSDSIMHFSPGVIHLLERGMKESTDSFTYYRYCLLKSKYFVLSAQQDSLNAYADSCIRFAQRQSPSPSQNTLIALALDYKAVGMHNCHQSPDAQIKLYTQAYRLLQDGEELFYLPDLCASLGDSYEQKNDLPQAANWYRRALFLADSLELPTDNRITLNMGLGYIYQNLGDYVTARQYYESIQAQVSKMEPSMQAYFLTNYGNMFYYSHDYRSALRVFLRLQKMLLEHHQRDSYDMYLCRINMADVYLNLHNLDYAEKYLSACYPYFVKLADPVALYYANTIRIGIAIHRNKPQQVASILANEKKAEGVDQNMINIRNGYLLSYYEVRGDFRTAYYLQNEVRMQHDSLEQNRQHMRAAEVMMRFEQDTLQLHHQLILQKMDAHIDHMYAVSTLLVVFILLIIAVTWVFYRHRRQENNMRLMQLRLTNARNRISPHFVFNVLNSRMGDSAQVQQDQLLTLASVIRKNLDLSTQQLVTLRQEVEFVQQYINLEQYLTGGFSFELLLPREDLLDQCQLPPMLLQILIENAIKHGVKSQPAGTGHIWVEVVLDNGDLTMTVRNDGVPFDIRKSGAGGTGLSIIRTSMMALNMIGRQRMSYHVTDDHGKGCCAVITIKQSKIKPTEK